MVIEQHAPDVPDRQVKLADGFPDIRGSRTIPHQPQRCFESEPRREQPVHHGIVQGPGVAVTILRLEQGHHGPVACSPGREIARRPYARLIWLGFRPVTGRA